MKILTVNKGIFGFYQAEAAGGAEQPTVAAPAATSADGIPAEVQAKISEAIKAIDEINEKQGLADAAAVFGVTLKDMGIEKLEDGTLGWMKKKVKRSVQSAIMKEAGIEPSAAVKAEDKKHDKSKATTGEAGEKKPGRKRMDTKGRYKVVIAEGQGAGRSGSYKNKIVQAAQAKGDFNFDEFKEFVKDAYGFGENGEATGQTNFKNLDAAAAAWFSELKNKQGIVVEATS